MELNREQIEKALDWLDSLVGNSYDSDSEMAMLTYQLLGILYDTCEELTDENKRLRAAVRTDIVICRARGSGKTEFLRNNLRLRKEVIVADAVKKLQDMFALHFGTYTDKDEVKVLEVFKLLGKFAEEIVEGGE